MSPIPYDKPLPKIDGVNQPFWDHARENRLAIQVCDDCGDRHIPPSPRCPACLSAEQSWVVVSGRGELMSWVEFHHAYWPAFKAELPYRACLVRLEEGPLLVSSLIGTTGTPPIGAPVEVRFEAVTENITLPRFVLA